MTNDKHEQIKRRFHEIEQSLSSPDIARDSNQLKNLHLEYDSLKTAASFISELEDIENRLQQAEDTLANTEDADLNTIATEEIESLSAQKKTIEEKLAEHLRPKDPRDQKDIIIEIRAGVGGDEAELFAADIFRMYSRFAERQGWKTIILAADRTPISGFKEIIFELDGKNVFSYLKYESGVHRVQRIPETEKSGRIHTSTASVAIMPKIEEVEFALNPQDIKIEATTASGHGGQSVNTTYSAIRMTHLPTGIVVSCQDERSQAQNKLRAFSILRARVAALEEEKRRSEERSLRKSQIGMSERSEKIRTYNYPQDRITDHRIKESWHNIAAILDGDITDIIDALRRAETAQYENN